MKKLIALAVVIVGYKKAKSLFQEQDITLNVTGEYNDKLSEMLETYGFKRLRYSWFCEADDCAFRTYSSGWSSLEAQRQRHLMKKHYIQL